MKWTKRVAIEIVAFTALWAAIDYHEARHSWFSVALVSFVAGVVMPEAFAWITFASRKKDA